MTKDEAISIAREFLLERHKNDTVDTLASIMKASTDEPKILAHYLRQHIEFLTKVAKKIER